MSRSVGHGSWIYHQRVILKVIHQSSKHAGDLGVILCIHKQNNENDMNQLQQQEWPPVESGTETEKAANSSSAAEA